MSKDKRNWKDFTSKLITVIILIVISFLGIDNLSPEGEMKLHMIDCGQADSFLLVQNGTTVLIDCGDTDTVDDVVNYLREQEITTIDYVIGTHHHSDHMGGMQEILKNFGVEKVVIPKIKAGKVTAKWYRNLLEELKNYDVEYASLGNIYEVGDATMKIIGPIEEHTDINNYSIVLKVTYGEMDVIMTGDAEAPVEKEIIASGEDINAEILKVGHHGSDTSTTEEWLNMINPRYALISCKVGNQHDHPSQSTMDKLKARNVEIYRTDECGSVVATITTQDVKFDKEHGDYLSGIEVERRYANP